MHADPIAVPSPALKLQTVVTVLGDSTRWQILTELAKGEPLPVGELARRLGEPHTNVSKHVTVLRRTGVIAQGFGRDYHINPAYQVPGERAIDLGWALLRLGELA